MTSMSRPYFSEAMNFKTALSIAYEGEFADVDAFNQPGVESYKRIMGPKLEALKTAKK